MSLYQLMKYGPEATRVQLQTKLFPNLRTNLSSYVPMLEIKSGGYQDYGDVNTIHPITGASLVDALANRSTFFDGSDDYVNLTAGVADIGTLDFSCNIWAKYTSQPNDQVSVDLVSYDGSHTETTNFSITPRDSGALGVNVASINSSGISPGLNYNKFNMISVIADRDGLATVYKNANPVGSFDISSGAAGSIGTGKNKSIGRRAVATYVYHRGYAKNFRMYKNRLLTRQDLLKIYEIER